MDAYRPYWRWLIPIWIGLIMFANHYPRDVVGALEKQLEARLVTPAEYAFMNSLYFLPNIITPLIAGHFIDRLGGISSSFVMFTSIGALGHALFALGAQVSSIHLMFLGRFISGSVYEIIDAVMPIIYLNQFFTKEWEVVVGILNFLMRSGSVANFLASPLVFRSIDVQTALWLAAFVSSLSIFLLILSYYTESVWRRQSSAKTTKEAEVEVELSTFDLPPSSFSPSINSSENILPSRQFSVSFYGYVVGGVFVYGAIVPFWFIGSKFLQDSFALSVVEGDFLMIVPELVIIAVVLPLSILSKKYQWSLCFKQMIVCGASATIAGSYLALALLAQNASHVLIIMIFLGLGFALSTCIFWGCFHDVVEANAATVARASGLVSCAVNLLPALLPPLLVLLFSSHNLHAHIMCLSFMACVAGAASLGTASLARAPSSYSTLPKPPLHEDEEGE